MGVQSCSYLRSVCVVSLKKQTNLVTTLLNRFKRPGTLEIRKYLEEH